jgi:hypothetical protein
MTTQSHEIALDVELKIALSRVAVYKHSCTSENQSND